MPHGVPSDAELAAAVRRFIEDEVMPTADPRLRFLARVAANALAQIERGLALGPEIREAHTERLADLGVADDAQLCKAIRSGSFDDRMDELLAALHADTTDKLRIANPRHIRS